MILKDGVGGGSQAAAKRAAIASLKTQGKKTMKKMAINTIKSGIKALAKSSHRPRKTFAPVIPFRLPLALCRTSESLRPQDAAKELVTDALLDALGLGNVCEDVLVMSCASVGSLFCLAPWGKPDITAACDVTESECHRERTSSRPFWDRK